MQIEVATSPNHGILTPGQAGLPLTVKRRMATSIPIFMFLVRFDQEYRATIHGSLALKPLVGCLLA